MRHARREGKAVHLLKIKIRILALDTRGVIMVIR